MNDKQTPETGLIDQVPPPIPSQKQPDQPQPHPLSDPIREELKQTLENNEAENQLIEEILEKGKISVYAHLSKHNSSNKASGLTMMTANNGRGYPFLESEYQRDIPNQLLRLNCREGYTINPIIGSKVIQPAKKGSLWKKAQPELREKFPVQHQGEDAYDLSYSLGAIHSQHETWLDGNRPDIMRMNIVLPKSLAQEVDQAVQNNPRFLRNLLEKAAIKTGISKETWFNGKGEHKDRPVRPPFEQWDSSPEPNRIYRHDSGYSVNKANIKEF